jgi:hypothetical protein
MHEEQTALQQSMLMLQVLWRAYGACDGLYRTFISLHAPIFEFTNLASILKLQAQQSKHEHAYSKTKVATIPNLSINVR